MASAPNKFIQLIFLLWICLSGTISHATIIESCTEDIAQAKGREYRGSKGGAENNKLENVSSPVRAGTNAFKHWVNTHGERSELALSKTEIGGTYWYGWSLMIPTNFDFTSSKTIVMQLATDPTPRTGQFPCGANGSFMQITPEGALVFHIQHQGNGLDPICESFTVLEDVSPTRGKWIDFVMHAKWTGVVDGYLKLWVKVGDGNYSQCLDYRGRSFWNDEDEGPYLKLGACMDAPGWKGPPERTLFTDEYRLGDANSSFDEVAPGAGERRGKTRSANASGLPADRGRFE